MDTQTKDGTNIRVLGINGSPRIGGNTDILLDKALEGARNEGAAAEKIMLNELDFVPCQEEEYDRIKENGFSVIEDDMQIVFSKIRESQAVILASPIFFSSLTAQAKMMIDRFQCVWISKTRLHKNPFDQKKRGAFICVEASRKKEFFENAKYIVKNFFFVINVRYSMDLFVPGIDQKGSILEHPHYLDKAYQLGRDIALPLV
jgi:multimeric flavodoxin WrbA